MAADAGQHRTHKVFRPRATSHPTALDALALLCQIFQKYRLRLKAELLPTAVHWLRRRIHGQERRIDCQPRPPKDCLSSGRICHLPLLRETHVCAFAPFQPETQHSGLPRTDLRLTAPSFPYPCFPPDRNCRARGKSTPPAALPRVMTMSRRKASTLQAPAMVK